MSRSRNIKPGFFRNEELATLNPLTRIFFVGLWCEADRRGIVEDRPKRLKADILPYDKANPESMLENLESLGFIQRYEIDGVRCIFIVKFADHQNPHRDERASTLPAPCRHSVSTVQTPEIHEPSTADSLNTDSLLLVTDSSVNPPVGPPPENPEPRLVRIPEDFSLDDDMIAWARSKGFDQPQIDHHTEAFVSHWRGEGGPKSRKVNWRQAWQTWMSRETPGRWPGAKSPNGRASPNGRSIMADAFDELRRERGEPTEQDKDVVDVTNYRMGV